MVNKRGQQSTIGTTIALVLGLLLVVGIGILIFRASTGVGEFIETLDPGAFDAKTIACKTTANTKSSFCLFGDVGEKKGNVYINCEYTGTNFDIGEAKGKFECDTDTVEKFCNGLKEDGDFTMAEVNDVPCKK